MKKAIPWNIFWMLLAASLLSVAAIFPYVLTIQADVLRNIPVPLTTLFFMQIIQCVIMFSVTIFFGLRLSRQMHFHLPLLEAITKRKSSRKIFADMTRISAPLGVLVALIIYVTDIGFTYAGTGISTGISIVPIWQKLLAALYGGITEEILMRFFLMTLLIWIMTKVSRKTVPTDWSIYISIILAAILFGLGHLPITASITTITPLVVVRAIVLNGIGGLVFGWLYWKKGLEAAMIAHFTTDVVLLSVLPLLLPYSV